jgi:hypothetical protein
VYHKLLSLIYCLKEMKQSNILKQFIIVELDKSHSYFLSTYLNRGSPPVASQKETNT